MKIDINVMHVSDGYEEYKREEYEQNEEQLTMLMCKLYSEQVPINNGDEISLTDDNEDLLVWVIVNKWVRINKNTIYITYVLKDSE